MLLHNDRGGSVNMPTLCFLLLLLLEICHGVIMVACTANSPTPASQQLQNCTLIPGLKRLACFYATIRARWCLECKIYILHKVVLCIVLSRCDL